MRNFQLNFYLENGQTKSFCPNGTTVNTDACIESNLEIQESFWELSFACPDLIMVIIIIKVKIEHLLRFL